VEFGLGSNKGIANCYLVIKISDLGFKNMADGIKKSRRRRPPFSCVHCRKRKVKCDRGRPTCMRCRKSNVECVYDGPADWSHIDQSSVKSSHELSSLQALGIHELSKTPVGFFDVSSSKTSSRFENYKPIQFQSAINGQQRSMISNGSLPERSIPVSSVNSPASFHSENIREYNFVTRDPVPNTPMTVVSNIKSGPGGSLPSTTVVSNAGFVASTSPSVSDSSLKFPTGGNFSQKLPPSLPMVPQVTSGSVVPLPVAPLPQIVSSPYSKSYLFCPVNGVSSGMNDNAAQKRKRLTDQESNDRISLVLDEFGKNILTIGIKKNRMGAFGSFKMGILWKRDPLMNTMFAKFRLMKKKVEAKVVAEPNPFPKKSSGYLSGLKNLERQVKLRKRMSKQKYMVKDDKDLEDMMASLFPPQDVLNWHLNRFFRYIYPLCPIFDEYIVLMYTKRIVVYGSNSVGDNSVHLEINTKLDLVRAATLLLILRLSYISVYLETETSNPSSPKYDQKILTNPIEANTMTLARMVLERVNFLRKTSLEDMQLLLLIRLYQIVAPEDGDGGNYGDGCIFVGVLVSTAVSIGLNRKIDNVVKTDTFARTADSFHNLWDKLWITCMEMDLEMSLVYGKKPYINIDDWDTPFPSSDIKNANLQDFYADKYSIDRLSKFMRIYNELYPLVSSLHRLREPPSIEHVMLQINSVTKLCNELYPVSLQEGYLTAGVFSLDVINSIKSILVIYPFIINVQYYLLLHFESTDQFDKFLTVFNQAIDNVLYALQISVGAFVRIFTTMSAHALMLNAYIIQAVNKIIYILLSFSVHVRLASYRVESQISKEGDRMYSEVRESQEKLKKQFESLRENIFEIMKLANKCPAFSLEHYYTSFRSYGNCKCLIGWTKQGGKPIFDFEDPSWLEHSNLIERFSYEQVQSINKRMEKFLSLDSCVNLSQMTRRWTSNPESNTFKFKDFCPKIDASGKIVLNTGMLNYKNSNNENMGMKMEHAFSGNESGSSLLSEKQDKTSDNDESILGTLTSADPSFEGLESADNWLQIPDLVDSLDIMSEFGML